MGRQFRERGQLRFNGLGREQSARNFPVQANGAEMLRLALCFGTEVDEIIGIDKELIAARYQAAIIEANTPAGSIAEFTALRGRKQRFN